MTVAERPVPRSVRGDRLMGCVDWGELVALYDDRDRHGGKPVAEGTLRAMARQALAASPAIRAHLRILSPGMGSIDELDICALATVPGFLDDIPLRAAA